MTLNQRWPTGNPLLCSCGAATMPSITLQNLISKRDIGPVICTFNNSQLAITQRYKNVIGTSTTYLDVPRTLPQRYVLAGQLLGPESTVCQNQINNIQMDQKIFRNVGPTLTKRPWRLYNVEYISATWHTRFEYIIKNYPSYRLPTRIHTIHIGTTSSTEPYSLMKMFLTVFKIDGIVTLTINRR